ncbi:Dabb family protein [Paracandidimonas soli]|uniref:Stress responsive alpha/beta barrel protein n=1 Tax=Paracandidimonas soli TaxID=1917182 RepID=A0A4R3VC55_9BURK|nr:Dabb family protein [Paracandidimonas soli]TCV02886.1 stress responsive alpha/beta barrel protein [Paracandidimonas soli]
MSMRHIVLFRRKADVPRNPALEQALVERMETLGSRIPCILDWRIGANEMDRPICWDYVLESEVADAEALNTYLMHPLHQALIADLKPYFEWAAVDYTIKA